MGAQTKGIAFTTMSTGPLIGAAIAAAGIMFSAEAQVIHVSTPQELDNVRNDLAAHYVQTADIDLSGYALAPIGGLSNAFEGVFDGDGYVISNFSYTGAVGESQVGLFGATERATISDVTLEDAHVTGLNDVGTLVGYAFDSNINACTVRTGQLSTTPSSATGTIAVGGLIGRIEGTEVVQCRAYAHSHCYIRWSGGMIGHIHIGSHVRNCQAYGRVTGGKAVGGFSGNIHGSLVEYCTAEGDVQGESVCGGFTGYFQQDLAEKPQPSIARNCAAAGNVVSTSCQYLSFTEQSGEEIFIRQSDGGFSAYLQANSIVKNCTAEGSVDSGTCDAACGGLIGFAERDCVIRGCTAYGEVIFGGTAAGLVGWALDDTLIEYCSAFGDVTGIWQSGGLVGAAERPVIQFCHAYGDVFVSGLSGSGHAEWGHPSAAVGGLVGYTFPYKYGPLGTQVHCSSAHGDVSSTGQMTGGLIGLCWGTLVTECYATGSVSSTERRLGGLIGGVLAVSTDDPEIPDQFERSEIYDCHASGSVTQNADSKDDQGLVGGLIGFIDGAQYIDNLVENTYSTGLVTATGSDIGGLIGEASFQTTVNSSYWDVQTSHQASSDGGTGKSTAEMMQQATFVGWDFSSMWGIKEGATYPYLLCPAP